MRTTLSPFQNFLKKLSRTTQVLTKTSEDISKSSESLSSGVNQQAEVVQETTAAMSEMSSMLSQTSEYAKQSDQVMAVMTQKANQGMTTMNQMVEAMSSVQQGNEQLKQMVKIISEIANKTNVINDIVFKTQLLSFNASIEAARAGQHGRGFAVVAEEVGNLAKMSGTAAQEIAALLQDSERQVNEIVLTTSERVNMGRSVAEQAMENFKEIAHDIVQTSTQIANISSATREQEMGVAQTTQAMSELNKTTEINAQIAQRSNHAATTLKYETDMLGSIAQSIQKALLGENAKIVGKNSNDGDDNDIDGVVDVKAAPAAQEKAAEPRADDQISISNLSDRVVELAKKKQWGAPDEEETVSNPKEERKLG
jgi:methyl-accepting chemotaxis protein